VDPQKIVNEYVSAIGTGARFILTLVFSAIIAEKITRFLETNNVFAYALVLLCVATLVQVSINAYFNKRKSKQAKPIKRGGYD